MRVRSILMLVAIAGATLLAAAIANAQPSPVAMSNPSAQNTDEARRKGPCRDPWITIAYWMYTAGMDNPKGAGEVMECDPKWYRGGQWNSFSELYEAVYKYKQALAAQGLRTVAAITPRREKAFALVDSRGAVIGGALIGPDGATIIGNDAGSMVAAGAGNMVAAGAGNMVAAGAGNLISDNSGSLKAGGRTYRLQSAKRVIDLRNGSRLYIF